MSYVERHTISVTTATGGGATAYTDEIVTGRIANIIYTAATGAPFASTADFTITAEGSGIGLWTESNVTASKTVSPTQPSHTQAGATTTDPARTPIWLSNERVKVVIAQGGNTAQGTFEVIVA